ncbi:peptide chain release factor N(5)-glutamine methyltransferase [Neisseria lisongii]|uniref:Release factor glutamine methyltransferase n=1 Tax=Neisseria lisongii TaxID=2912188 RepID=A0AAW5APU3_9NEIS|nr:peptide chain release factor N(5)-glutamine methyltransferase [Neisseria lisongii]MCF7529045.1 peptide chain release factor N(5)-glutamine methyltransferase [Neisseria lisongii]
MNETAPITLENRLRQSPLPKLEIRMLLQAAGGYSRTELITRSGDMLPPEVLQRLHNFEQRRLAGEPMAYILGEREFYGRIFQVNPSVLIPRSETEHLLEAAIERLPQGGTAWDLGTGSGALAVSLALERPDAEVYASDISPQALATAQANARRLGANIHFSCGSWFDTDRPSEKPFDILVSNPPYIEQHDPHLNQGDLRFEPQTALTDFSDGLSHIRTLAQGAPKYLKSQGWLLLEHGYDQGSAVREILIQQGFTQTATLPDLAGCDRVTLGRWEGG